MASNAADQLFARFQRSGDPDLLAQVFDLTATKLLRLAIHLSQDPAAAEDLVQATFVTAMEKADQYQSDRPILPWLNGILEHHAKSSRTKARRRIEPERLSDPLTVDPERQAQENELGEAIDSALDRLPENYRTVLLLKLRHGMSPAQIADALARSPGAVRVQIHRGLEMLRKLLPASIAFAAICAFTPSRGLAAMRRELKRQAALNFAPVGSGIVLGGILMKKVVVSIALAAVAVTGGVFMFDLGGSASIPVADAGSIAGETEFTAVDVSAGSAIDRGSAHEFSIEDSQAQRMLASTPQVTNNNLLVKVLWADDQTPAAGVGLTVRPHDGRHPQLHTKRRVTDNTGLASFTDLAAGIVGIYADRKLHQPEAAWRMASSLQNLRNIELSLNGEVSVLPGLQGLQVDMATPTQSWNMAAPEKEYRAARMRYTEVAQQTLRADLHNMEESFILAEDWSEASSDFSRFLEENGGKVRLLDPLSLDLPSQLPDEEPVAIETISDEPVYVEILIERGIDLQGKVIDGSGQAIANAEIWVLSNSSDQGQILTRSDEDGSFSLQGLVAGSRVLARAAGFEPSDPFKLSKPKDNSKILEKEIILGNRAGILRGRVFDDQGNPLADAALRIGNPQSKLPQIHTRSDSEGGFQAVGLPRGEVLVVVLAAGFQPYQEQLSIQAESITERELHLQPGWVLAGQIFDPEGKALEGQTIYAESEGKPTTEVTSGKDGSFRMETLVPGPVTLVVKEDDFRELRQLVHGSPGQEQEQDLHLPAWGKIAGRIESSSGEPIDDWRIKAIPIAEGVKTRSDKSESDGGFDMQTEPDQPYRLLVYPNLPMTRGSLISTSGGTKQFYFSFASEDDSSGQPAGRRVIHCDWLGEITGSRADLVIRIPDELMPSAQLEGQVMNFQGQVLAGNLNVFVDGKKRSVKIDKAGRFDTGLLIPGDYLFQVVCKDNKYPPFYLDVAHLRASEKLDLGILNPPAAGSVQLQVMDNRAENRNRMQARVLDGSGRLLRSIRLDKQGTGLGSLAAGDYRVELTQGDAVIAERSLRITAGTTTPLRIEVND